MSNSETNATPLLMGVDAGGTGTRAAVARGDSVLATAAGQRGAIGAAGAMAAAVVISDVARAAMARAGIASGRVEVLVVGAAGAGREPQRSQLAQALRAERIAERVVVETDAAIALQDAFGDAPGMLLSVGTGSIAVARLADGQLARVGGWGWQLGDEGGGAWLGREALRLAVKTLDGRLDERRLLETLQAAAKCTDADALIRWGNAAGATELASLAPAILHAAAHGVEAAAALVDRAVEEAAGLALGLAERTGVRDVALNGGLADAPGFGPALRTALGSLWVREAPVDAVRGALKLAAAHAASGNG